MVNKGIPPALKIPHCKVGHEHGSYLPTWQPRARISRHGCSPQHLDLRDPETPISVTAHRLLADPQHAHPKDGPLTVPLPNGASLPCSVRDGRLRARPVTSWHKILCSDATTLPVRTQARDSAEMPNVLPGLLPFEALVVAYGTACAGDSAYRWPIDIESMKSMTEHSPEGELRQSADIDNDGMRERLAPVADIMRSSHNMVVFTGAGISTESGIPDYRGPDGVWKTNRIPTANDVPETLESRERRWQEHRKRYPQMQAKEPNAGHKAIAALERDGRVKSIVTQNIDGLHQKAGSAPERVLELHGSSHRLRCVQCGRVWDAESVLERLEHGETDPRCEVCGGVLRTSTVLFGESLPEETLRKAVEASANSDLMLVVGSSLVVKPAAQLPVVARKRGAGLVIVNREPTPLDEIANAVIRGESGPVLAALADMVVDGNASPSASDAKT